MKNNYGELTLNKYLQLVGSPTAVPGGGSVSALGGALGAALGSMVTGLSLKEGKEKIKSPSKRFLSRTQRLLRLAAEDAQAYQQVLEAYRLPQRTSAEKLHRTEKIQTALLGASQVPLQGMKISLENIISLNSVVDKIKPNLISDWAVAVLFSYAAFQGCLMNVKINLAYIKNKSTKMRIEKSIRQLNHKMKSAYQKALNRIDKIL